MEPELEGFLLYNRLNNWGWIPLRGICTGICVLVPVLVSVSFQEILYCTVSFLKGTFNDTTVYSFNLEC